MFSMPSALWFQSEVVDSLLALTIDDNWEEFGTESIDDATSAASIMIEGLQLMVGAIFPVCWETIPDNFLICDGSSYLREDYPTLYANLPSAFIVDADNFVVPTLQNKVIVGAGNDYAAGDEGGESSHTLSISEMPNHTHTDTGHFHTTHGHLSGLAVAPGELPVSIPGLADVTGTSNANLTDEGGGEPHNNMQPYQAITYVIAAR